MICEESKYKRSTFCNHHRHLDDGRVAVRPHCVQVDPELAQRVYGLEEALQEKRLVITMIAKLVSMTFGRLMRSVEVGKIVRLLLVLINH